MDRLRPASLSVIIPALDEEASIARVVKRVLALRPHLQARGLAGPEVIVVDDGSRDGTVAAVRAVGGVELVRHPENRGYGAALKTGLARATGDLVAFLDADGTYPPEQLPDLCAVALDGADLVIGSRMHAAATGMPTTRRIGNRLFAGLVTLLGERRVSDCASGMRVVRRDVLRRLYPLPDGLNFTPIMSLRAIHEGLDMAEVCIPYAERTGQSKLRVAADGVRYLGSILWTTLSYSPVRVLGMVGVAGVAVAAAIGAGLVTMRAAGITTLGPWGIAAVFAALVSGVAGVSVFALGVLFNYLVTLFRQQPTRVGLFGRPIFDPPLERHFRWMGIVTGSAGVGIAAVALTLGLRGWDVARLWLYLVGSALFILVGVQLVISWVLVAILDDLSQREARSGADLAGQARPGPSEAASRAAERP